MKGRRISRSVILTAAAAALTASLSVGSALAYFTTYCAAEGSVTMNMGFTDTEIDETVDSTGKHVTMDGRRTVITGIIRRYLLRERKPANCLLHTISRKAKIRRIIRNLISLQSMNVPR